VKPPSCVKAVSLVEILVGLAIVSVFIIPLVSLTTANRREAQSAETVLALWLAAQDQLAKGGGATNPGPDSRLVDGGLRHGLDGTLFIRHVAEVKLRDADFVLESLKADPYAGVAPAVDAFGKEPQ
jgi:type II secretory pathway pseudopilin PulG